MENISKFKYLLIIVVFVPFYLLRADVVFVDDGIRGDDNNLTKQLEQISDFGTYKRLDTGEKLRL